MNGAPNLTVGGEFSGIGMLDFGLHLAGLEHAWLCEVDPWRRSILEQRFPGVPVFDDVRAVGAASARPVDVIAGGFPCKGASTAGLRTGFEHPETVLWREMLRTIGELRPRYVLLENVANLLRLRPPGGQPGDLWREILGGLSALGFDVVWDCLPAAAVGAPHRRDRVFAVAWHPDQSPADPHAPAGRPRGAVGQRGVRPAPDPDRAGRLERGGAESARAEHAATERGGAAAADANGERRTPGRLAESPERGIGRGRGGRIGGTGSPQAAPDADRSTAGRQRDEDRSADRDAGRGVGVSWGAYGPAIRRWEEVHGPAPEPLVRRVDDGGARRVERSRLSALGDGVQVQVGLIAGRYIVECERERVGA